MFNPSHKVKRDLLTKMSSIRNTDGGLVVQRNDTYDKLGRPVTRQTLRSGGAMNETFDYNDRSESARRLAGRLDKSAAFAPKGRTADGAAVSQLIHATRTVGDSFDYAYDNIGNRVTAQEVNSGATSDVAYVTNDLNQYTQIDTNGSDFTPGYDKDGNQTLIQTETGIWRVTYNVQNRAIKFESKDGHTVITCDYDYMGRRVFKKVEKDGVVTAHERYLYRGYLQIASLNMMEGQSQALINAYVWDPTQPVATRPLAIFYKGVAYYYGWDLTKNITEIFSLSARLQIDYVYTPFGQVRENGIIQQSIQWSSEYHDAETGLVYYNFRYYNPRDGRWTRREPVMVNGGYVFCDNNSIKIIDRYGLFAETALAGGAAVAGGSIAASAAIVVVGVGLVALTIWGISTLVDNVADDATADETESIENTRDNFSYDRCAEWCMSAYNRCMGVEYYDKRCRPSAKKKCSDLYAACIRGCRGGKWPTETPGVRLY